MSESLTSERLERLEQLVRNATQAEAHGDNMSLSTDDVFVLLGIANAWLQLNRRPAPTMPLEGQDPIRDRYGEVQWDPEVRILFVEGCAQLANVRSRADIEAAAKSFKRAYYLLWPYMEGPTRFSAARNAARQTRARTPTAGRAWRRWGAHYEVGVVAVLALRAVHPRRRQRAGGAYDLGHGPGDRLQAAEHALEAVCWQRRGCWDRPARGGGGAREAAGEGVAEPGDTVPHSPD